jgi:hypothetical protein
MHGERYPDAPTAGAIVQQLGERIRQLETENEMLRDTVKLISEERGRLELELVQHKRMARRFADEERRLKGD